MGIMVKEGAVVTDRHKRQHIWVMVENAWQTRPPLKNDEMWITSGNDGHHMKGSKHFSDEAFDIRTRNIEAMGPDARERTAQTWCRKIKDRCGDKYDIIYEEQTWPGVAERVGHIHMEYDPKTPGRHLNSNPTRPPSKATHEGLKTGAAVVTALAAAGVAVAYLPDYAEVAGPTVTLGVAGGLKALGNVARNVSYDTTSLFARLFGATIGRLF